MIIYIDGDNTHGVRTAGAEALTEKDHIHVFYSTADKYYKRPENRSELQERSNAPVTFHVIQQGDNAVDFAIAMDAAVKAKAREKQAIILISSDKHFEVFGEQLQKRFPLCKIYVDHTLIDALVKHGLDNKNGLEMFRISLTHTFGEEEGAAMFERIGHLYSKRQKKGGRSILDSLRALFRR